MEAIQDLELSNCALARSPHVLFLISALDNSDALVPNTILYLFTKSIWLKYWTMQPDLAGTLDM